MNKSEAKKARKALFVAARHAKKKGYRYTGFIVGARFFHEIAMGRKP